MPPMMEGCGSAQVGSLCISIIILIMVIVLIIMVCYNYSQNNTQQQSVQNPALLAALVYKQNQHNTPNKFADNKNNTPLTNCEASVVTGTRGAILKGGTWHDVDCIYKSYYGSHYGRAWKYIGGNVNGCCIPIMNSAQQNSRFFDPNYPAAKPYYDA